MEGASAAEEGWVDALGREPLGRESLKTDALLVILGRVWAQRDALDPGPRVILDEEVVVVGRTFCILVLVYAAAEPVHSSISLISFTSATPVRTLE